MGLDIQGCPHGFPSGTVIRTTTSAVPRLSVDEPPAFSAWSTWVRCEVNGSPVRAADRSIDGFRDWLGR